ncbi:c-type cytochrome [Roseateles cellulosilyticus]|uniref:C-type cytochrome n=1 Tax=Pelomonas cellulosilytica TaxID=2906762 RepID=A0ABS8XY21_9BURK|nr:c-type cytochrome [Pelomonas sp. P8]MCE4556838.1 c-type cytochrome [Pelomonas sp. P8]
MKKSLLGVASAIALSSSAMAQDIAAGKVAFNQCVACHSVDGNNGAGPSLKGIDGRKAGSFPGFRYSRAMKSASVNWNTQTLDTYLTDPQKLVPGNVMPFSGVADAKQRADLVAYLSSLK